MITFWKNNATVIILSEIPYLMLRTNQASPLSLTLMRTKQVVTEVILTQTKLIYLTMFHRVVQRAKLILRDQKTV